MRLSQKRQAGDLLGTMFPGYKDKIWAQFSNDVKARLITRKMDAYESQIALHKQWGNILTQYKDIEKSFKPLHKARKPAVDWRRQEVRGTLHVGRFYEGPSSSEATVPSDYTPGNTFNRMDNVHALFSDKEWADRKNFRSWDMVKFSYYLLGGFFAYRLYGDWPIVWC